MGKSDTWKQQGKFLFASGKYEEAVKCLNRVLQKDPADTDAWIFKGRSLYYQHKYMDSMRCFEKALECEPGNEDSLKGIIQCSDKLILQSPKNSDLWDAKISALMDLGENEQAVEICDQDLGFALKNAPKAWSWKGQLLRRGGKHEEAVKYYNKILKQDSSNLPAWINKSRSLFLLGKAGECLICCDKALELDAENAKAWAIKSVALKKLHRYDEGEASLKKAKEFGYSD